MATMFENRDAYLRFAQENADLPLFLQPYWLDAVAPGKWAAAVVQDGEDIIAVWPYVVSRRAVWTVSEMPPYTPFLGFWIRYPEGQKASTRLNYEKETISALVAQLPRVAYFGQHFHTQVRNIQPLHWHRFALGLRYTYAIHPPQLTDSLLANMTSSPRAQLKKNKGLSLVSEWNPDLLFALHEQTFRKQGAEISQNHAVFRDLMAATKKAGVARMSFAKDEHGNVHAGIFTAWDQQRFYYLVGAINEKFKSSRAMTNLLFSEINAAMQMDKIFDFEGSMIEPIAEFFRSFGAEQRPYFTANVIRSRSLKIARSVLGK